jgi:FtsH-binding integral membrane protein
MVISIFSKEEETTMRFQLIFGLIGLAVALVGFWAGSQFDTVNLKYGFLFVCVLVSITWLKESLFMLADVAINIMKKRED